MLKLRPSKLLIPFAPSPRLLLWIAGFFCALTLFSCWQRSRDAKAVAKDTAQQQAYEVERAKLTERIAQATRDAAIAQDRADSLAKVNVLLGKKIVANAPRRVSTVRPLTDSIVSTDMVSVCLESPPGCYPTHYVLAGVMQSLDSLVHDVVIGELLPQIEAEREGWRNTNRYNVAVAQAERAARERAEWRVRQQNVTIAALTPKKWERRLETAKHVGYFLTGLYLGSKVTRWVVQ